MKRRSLAGNAAIGVFVITLVCVFVAFCAPAWLVSDYRITGAKLDKLGLWSHCFRSLADPSDAYQKRFFVGCRWVYDPFTTGYGEILGFLLPRFSGGIAVIVFASLGNGKDWMPEHENNYLGWAFGLGVVGVVMAFISGILFLVEYNVQNKKKKYLKESQTRFEMEHESKA